MKKLWHNMTVLGVWLLLGARLIAAEQETTMTLRFLFMDESHSAYFLEDGDKIIRLSGSPYAISRPVKVEFGQPLKLLRAESSSKKAPQRPILTVTAPDSGVSALVVVKPNADEAGGYDATVLETGSEQRNADSLQLYNLGVTDAAVLIGEQMQQVSPGQAKLIAMAPDSRRRVVAKVGEKTIEGWRLIYDGVLAVRPGQMMTAVIVYSPTGLRYTYTEQEIEEFGEPEPGHFWLTFSENAPVQ